MGEGKGSQALPKKENGRVIVTPESDEARDDRLRGMVQGVLCF